MERRDSTQSDVTRRSSAGSIASAPTPPPTFPPAIPAFNRSDMFQSLRPMASTESLNFAMTSKPQRLTLEDSYGPITPYAKRPSDGLMLSDVASLQSRGIAEEVRQQTLTMLSKKEEDEEEQEEEEEDEEEAWNLLRLPRLQHLHHLYI
ncbi:hypothetical protein ACEQ8H_003457 [Pleosporales sp. CAS-2024a]